MRGAMALSLILLGVAGCKSQPPAADPFSSHPIVPPPGTGACPTDPGYAPVTSPASPSQPGLPLNPQPQPTGATFGNGWAAAPTTGQNTLAPSNPASGSLPTGAVSSPTTGAGGAVVIPPSTPPANGSANPASPGTPINSYPANGAINPGLTGYNAAPGGSTAGLGSAAVAANASFGAPAPHIIPPPPTATAGGNPNSVAAPSAVAPGLAAYSMDNRYSLPGGSAAARTASVSAASPILGTPRPTPSQAYNPVARPAAAVSSSVLPDYRGPRPVDDTAPPIRSPLAPTNGVPANSTVATVPAGSRQTAPQPAVYGNALPAYGSPFQTVVIEPNWQPCDGYADGPE
jgi:hypothetical protein